ncbi:hypothetical protein DFH09DRAFT_1470444 [Mycena vulgaris]|nr:hypothetical protein DFH09DRAFT_1470444 [Mycena vulgaris]
MAAAEKDWLAIEFAGKSPILKRGQVVSDCCEVGIRSAKEKGGSATINVEAVKLNELMRQPERKRSMTLSPAKDVGSRAREKEGRVTAVVVAGRKKYTGTAKHAHIHNNNPQYDSQTLGAEPTRSPSPPQLDLRIGLRWRYAQDMEFALYGYRGVDHEVGEPMRAGVIETPHISAVECDAHEMADSTTGERDGDRSAGRSAEVTRNRRVTVNHGRGPIIYEVFAAPKRGADSTTLSGVYFFSRTASCDNDHRRKL